MVKEILLVHHTHTDIGYTHPQPIVHELHHRFIDQALDLADQGQEVREDARFRWTCEVTATTRAWWEAAQEEDRKRFRSAVERGQFEVAALEWHLTPLADLRMLVRSLKNVEFFRQEGIPIRSAMNTDVNGVPWGMVDCLLDHGVTGFSMAINSHFGGPVEPRPGAFRWASPSGREITVWNGFQYWHAANHLLRMPSSVEAVSSVLPGFLEELERRGYRLPFLPLQITNLHHPDNAEPDPGLAPFIREWNDRSPEVTIRTVLLSEMFDLLRTQDLPALSGDWTDYWNFGAGSSARETSVLMGGLRTLDAAHQLSAWPGSREKRESAHLDAAYDGLALYAEHTWGADRSTTHPESLETHLQWALKAAPVYEGLSHARIVLRDSLHRLSREMGGEEPSLLLYNPLAQPVKVQALVPVEGLDWALNSGSHHLHRMDGSLADLKPEATRWIQADLPAMGCRSYPLSSLPLAPSEGLESGEGAAEAGPWIRSDRVALRFAPEGGLASLLLDGREQVGEAEDFVFGLPVLERPAGGTRGEIMSLHFHLFELGDGWVEDWPRITTPGRLTGQSGRVIDGAVEHRQEFEMENGDRVSVLYRLFAGDPSVDLEVVVTSAGDPSPASLALPFVLPEGGPCEWRFDTAGAVVKFDEEQLPGSCRHYVTTRKFVRIQTESSALSIATPDLPLWMLGGMFFAPTRHLKPEDRKPVALAWLANNYWEVNFRASQTGQTLSRFRLLPHDPEPVAESLQRVLPYATPPILHSYRGAGERRKEAASLMEIEAEGVSLESFVAEEGRAHLVLMNVTEEPALVLLNPSASAWEEGWKGRLDGSPLTPLMKTVRGWEVPLGAREAAGVVLTGFRRA